MFILSLPVVVLGLIGIPGPLLRPFIRRLEREQLFIEVSRLRWDLPVGVAVDGLRYYGDSARRSPRLAVGTLAFALDPRAWFRGRAGVRSVGARDVVWVLDPAGDPEAPGNLAIEHVRARLQVEPAGVRVVGLDGALLGMRVEAEGFVASPPETGGPRASPADWSRRLCRALDRLPPWLAGAVEQIGGVEHERPPRLQATFHVDPARPVLSRAHLVARGSGGRMRNTNLDGWGLEAHLAGGVLEVSDLTGRRGEQECRATASLDFAAGTGRFRAYSTLDPAFWICLVPASWCARMGREWFVFSGPSSFEVWGGPAPIAQLPEQMAGWLSFEQALLRGVWVDKAFLSFKREGGTLDVTKVEASIGMEDDRGLLRGEGSCRLDNLDYRAHIETTFDPNAFVTLWTSNQMEFIRALDFETPPRTTFDVSGNFADVKRFAASAHLEGARFTYRGAAVSRFESDLAYSNDVLTLAPMRIHREEGNIAGALVLDFVRQWADFDLACSADPYAAAQMIGPATHRFLRNYRFEGPAYVVATGRVDYARQEATDFEAWVDGQRMGMDWALADRCAFRVRARGTTVEFSDVQASVYGGALTGTAVFTHIDQTNNVHYDIRCELRDVDFARMVAAMEWENADLYTGILTATVGVRGVVGEGRGDTAAGSGFLRITQGQVFRVPLFGGLSRILSKLYPNLGFVRQTECRASFVIGDRKVTTSDAYIEGPVLSATGQGEYRFNERLDMNIRVQLLRGGKLTAVLRLVTFPVTKLLEFHLDGALRDPKWRPVNLPKELFLIFD
jgi:hypothetical protein